MQVHWKSRRTIALITTLLLLYLFTRVNNYEHKESVILPKVHPNQVWEFVADFSNMKYLNPTMVDFNIISESGNYKHWKYSVEYDENLSHWPYLPNHSIAHFDIKASASGDSYFIYSNHTTCLFKSLYCLNSSSMFHFSHSNQTKGTRVEELVNYKCPAIFSWFCRREVVYQRTAIKENLGKKFFK